MVRAEAIGELEQYHNLTLYIYIFYSKWFPITVGIKVIDMNVALAYRACLLEVNLWTCVMVGWYGAVACHEHVLAASTKIFRIPDPSMELSMIPVSFFLVSGFIS